MATENHPPFITLECCLYQNTQSLYSHRGDIEEDNIANWLGDNLTASPDGKPLVAGLKLVFALQTHINHPFKNTTTFKTVNDLLGVPQSHACYIATFSEGSGKYSISSTQSVLISSQANLTVHSSFVMRHDSASNITTGYVLWQRHVPINKILDAVQDQFPSTPHPLLVPIMLCESVITHQQAWMEHETAAIHGIEAATRFIDESVLVITAKLEKKEETLNFPEVIENLGKQTALAAYRDFSLRLALDRLDFILKQLQSKDGGLVDVVETMIRERAEFAKSALQGLLLKGVMHDRRLQAQQTVVFNLITQEDSRANLSIAADSKQLAADSKQLAEDSIAVAADSRELAAASKRDSSAMKIIAYMTTLFLPATFVSTLFSMPMFDWTVPRISDAAGGHMWFYWTIAIPLTVLVVSIFGVYAWYQGRKNRVIAQKAREGADEKVKDV